jgi:hypothetical protein
LPCWLWHSRKGTLLLVQKASAPERLNKRIPLIQHVSISSPLTQAKKKKEHYVHQREYFSRRHCNTSLKSKRDLADPRTVRKKGKKKKIPNALQGAQITLAIPSKFTSTLTLHQSLVRFRLQVNNRIGRFEHPSFTHHVEHRSGNAVNCTPRYQREFQITEVDTRVYCICTCVHT